MTRAHAASARRGCDLTDFDARRVLVVGDLMLDRYLHGATSRISPEAPVPVVHICSDEVRPGGAGNVALNVTALGAQATLLALIGADEAGRQLEARLAAGGVAIRLARCPSKRTITKLRVMSQHQQMIRLDFEDGFSRAEAAALRPKFESEVGAADVVVFSDYAKGSLQGVEALIALTCARGTPVIVDPKGTDFERYRGATVVKPNLRELEAIVGPCSSEESMVARGETLRDALDLQALVITRSERGLSILERGCAPVHLGTHAHEVSDVTGAGDTVTAALACGLAAGLPLVEAAGLANRAAAIAVAKLGTATVTRAELQAALRASAPATPRGIVALEQISECLARAHASGETVVALISPRGPPDVSFLRRLEWARDAGDRLLLLAPLADRQEAHDCLALYAALRAVDWVVETAPAHAEALLDELAPQLCAFPAGTSNDALPDPRWPADAPRAGARATRAAGQVT